MKFRNNAIAVGVLTALGSVSGAMAQDSVTSSTPISATVQAFCTMQIEATDLTNNAGFFEGDELYIRPYVACNAFGGAQFKVSATNGGFRHESSNTLIPYSVELAVEVLNFLQSGQAAPGTIIDTALGGGGGLAVASVESDVEGTVTVTLQGATAYAGDYDETLAFTITAIN